MQSIKWIYVLLNCAEGEKLMCTKYELVNNRTKEGEGTYTIRTCGYLIINFR